MKIIRTVFIFLFLAKKIFGELRRVVPASLEIQEGEDMQLRLLTNLLDEESCYVRTPWLENINLKSDESEDERIQFWSENEKCGVKVKNVRKDDEGWWRITSKNSSNQTLVDAVNVKILGKVGSIEKKFSIVSGLEYDLVLAYESNFCTVNHPSLHQDSEVIGKDCKINIQKPTLANAGNWTAEVGVKGKIEEVSAIADITISDHEYLKFGHIQKNPQLLHLYCNLFNYDPVPDLCRFSRPNHNQTAFQLIGGIRKGKYGYYGDGLDKKECGLTIENPTNEDLGMWHCLTGKIGGNVLGAFINIKSLTRNAQLDEIIVTAESPVITTFQKELNLECSANVVLKYCWFSGPKGIILIPTDRDENNLNVSTSVKKESNARKCSIKIKSAEESHNGTWTCHLGPDTPGLEKTKDIDVRISETPLAAIEKLILVQSIRDKMTLQCKIVPKPDSLKYCRFLSPSGMGIHINENIRENSAISSGNMRIWFSGKSTASGDCGITLKDFTSKEIGIWKCAGRLDENNEVFDTIHVFLKEQDESENLTVAASLGISVGIIAILVFISFGGLYLHKKYKRKINPPQISVSSSAENSPRISQSVELVRLGF